MKNLKLTFPLILKFTLALTIVTFTACEEDDDDHHNGPDTEAPVFTITSPTAMQVFMNTDTVFLKGTVADDKSMHELDIEIKNSANDSILYSKTQSVHDLTTYDIDFFWKSSVNDHTNALVIFSAEDHGGNVGRDTVHIHIMP